MTRALRELPKANLHLHLTGSMRSATLVELADRYGIAVPPPIGPGVHAWPEFQARYDAARSTIRTADDVRRVVAEAARDAEADGCRWLELQFDPTSYEHLLGGLEPVVEAVLDGLSGAAAAAVLSSSWARSGSHAERLARIAVRYRDQGIVGFGLSNDERLGKVEDFAQAFRIATDAGLLAVPHGGFYQAAWHVRACVETLRADRIGHGLTAAADPQTVRLLAERQVALEVCPTSYPPFGGAKAADLPLRALLDAGVPVALASDDPLLFGASVTDQYTIARQETGLSDDELAAIARHSIMASAASDEAKRGMTAAVDAWLRPADSRQASTSG